MRHAASSRAPGLLVSAGLAGTMTIRQRVPVACWAKSCGRCHRSFAMVPPALPYRHWLAQALGLLAFHLVWLGAGREDGLWLPGLGLGLALVSWFGWWYAALLAI